VYCHLRWSQVLLSCDFLIKALGHTMPRPKTTSCVSLVYEKALVYDSPPSQLDLFGYVT
jgi:hypothetical protein